MILPILLHILSLPHTFCFCSLISSLNHDLGCLVGSFLVTIGVCLSRTLLSSCWNTYIIIARSRSSVTPVITRSLMKAYISILLSLQYVMFPCVSLSLLYFMSHLTTQWSDINGPGLHLSISILDASSVKTRSMVLPSWCVPKSTHCCKPNASMVSMKIFMSASVSILVVCMLKCANSRILPSVMSWSAIHIVNSWINIAMVTGWFVEYGGLYITIQVTLFPGRLTLHLAASMLLDLSMSREDVVRLDFVMSATPPPL